MEAGLTVYKEVQGSICGEEECVCFYRSHWPLQHQLPTARSQEDWPTLELCRDCLCTCPTRLTKKTWTVQNLNIAVKNWSWKYIFKNFPTKSQRFWRFWPMRWFVRWIDKKIYRKNVLFFRTDVTYVGSHDKFTASENAILGEDGILLTNTSLDTNKT